MIDFKLSNILLQPGDRFENNRHLYVRSTSPHVFDPDTGMITFLPYGEYDFETYFNSFSNKKWRQYANVDNVTIRFEFKGDATFRFTSLSYQPIGLGHKTFDTKRLTSDDFTVFEFEYPDVDDTILGFKMVTHDYSSICNAYYYTKVDESVVRDVHLALATTTFKKEDYVKANVALFKKDIQQGNDPITGTASMIVVDNGRTLDAAELEGDGVYVFPNKNVGGSGGFARGMIEAKRLPHPATHVLIMDDDISLSSESIKRTHNLFSLVRDEYVEAFVSGAMFSLGDQHIQIEDVGYAKNTGKFGGVKPGYNMAFPWDVVNNEDDIPLRHNMYAAFWYCGIPMTVIEREGLPLPLFIRYDDAEYGQRCKPKFMTMNGINVWHMDFTDRYSAFYERYYAMRNSLTIQATTGVCPNIDFMGKLFYPNFKREMKKLNYTSAEFLLDGVDDFLKGPDYIAQERCEEILKEKMPKQEKFQPLEDIGMEGVNLDGMYTKKKRSTMTRAIDSFTYNGQRFTPQGMRKKGIISVPFEPDKYSGERFRRRKKVLVVDRFGKKGFVREADDKKFKELMRRYKATVKNYKANHAKVEQAYAAARDYLVSEEFWKKYLEID